MKIGDVAKQLNMPSSTIRFYEKKRLIPIPRRISGKRYFDEKIVATLRFIQLCQTAGFSINEIGNLIEQFNEDQSKSGVCQPAVVLKRAQIKRQIDELKQIDAVLGEMTKCRCNSIEQCLSFALQS